MSHKECYTVHKKIGTFSDENGFKLKFMELLQKQESIKQIFAIENSVEPGMPDLIAINSKDVSTFIEVKYAKNGTISFKRTQIPWYRRHKNLNVKVVAYNDKTKNIHLMDSSVILTKANSLFVQLEDEENFEIEDTI